MLTKIQTVKKLMMNIPTIEPKACTYKAHVLFAVVLVVESTPLQVQLRSFLAHISGMSGVLLSHCRTPADF